eukprot:5580736-Alexandrium_andersonii.AAC.1
MPPRRSSALPAGPGPVRLDSGPRRSAAGWPPNGPPQRPGAPRSSPDGPARPPRAAEARRRPLRPGAPSSPPCK